MTASNPDTVSAAAHAGTAKVAESSARLAASLFTSLMLLAGVIIAAVIVSLRSDKFPYVLAGAGVMAFLCGVLYLCVLWYFSRHATSVTVSASRLALLASWVGTFLTVYGPVRVLIASTNGTLDIRQVIFAVALSLSGVAVWIRGDQHRLVVRKARREAAETSD